MFDSSCWEGLTDAEKSQWEEDDDFRLFGDLGAWEDLTLSEWGRKHRGAGAQLIPLDPVNGKVTVNVTESAGRYHLFVGGEKRRERGQE